MTNGSKTPTRSRLAETSRRGLLGCHTNAVFIRFVVRERDSDSNQPMGVFTALYGLERAGKLEEYEVEWFRDVEAWFNTNLPRPDRFTASRRPNAAKQAISWFKSSATEYVSRMRQLVVLLEHKDILVEELRSEKPGYVVYEDDVQITVLPFHGEQI